MDDGNAVPVDRRPGLEARRIAHVGLGGRCGRSRFPGGVDGSRHCGPLDLFGARGRPDRIRVRTCVRELPRGDEQRHRRGGLRIDPGRWARTSSAVSWSRTCIRMPRRSFVTISEMSPALRRNVACGHLGPTLSNVHGRAKNLLKHRDGTISPFYLGELLIAKLPQFREYRIRQTAIGVLVVELGGGTNLNQDEQDTILNLVRKQTGAEFQVELRSRPGNRLGRPGQAARLLQRSVMICAGLARARIADRRERRSRPPTGAGSGARSRAKACSKKL